ncbi:hypothetical protein N431DRAFT_445889 [Stipitochalara longipes BDJ]|nr:hypothetical protein N431DRAFT_445889 [Stipitochalara longipes BDJ]
MGEGIYFDLEHGGEDAREPLFFMPVIEYPSIVEGFVSIYGLIVKPVDGDGHFGRVGIWDIMTSFEFYDELMQQLLSQPGTLMEETMYQEILEPEHNGLPQYIITLV